MGFFKDLLSTVAGPVVSGLFGADQSAKNIAAQQESVRNKHQYEVADLRKAGLNPILSAKYGGAGGISGAQASMPSFDLNAARRISQETKNLAKQEIVLDKEADQATIISDIYKKFPEVAIARALAGSSSADKVMAAILNRGGKAAESVMGETNNSAKSVDERIKDYVHGNDKTLTIDIPAKKKDKGITEKENREIDKQIREQYRRNPEGIGGYLR